MPELPELEIIKETLTSQIKGKKVKKLQILKPYILKNYFIGNLTEEKIEAIERKGKYLIIKLSKHKIIIHLMLRGFIKFVKQIKDVKKSTAALVQFEDGTLLEIAESGHKKRMSMYIIPKDELLKQVERLGIEPLQDDFTIEKLASLLQGEAKQLKSFLCDQKKIAGIGNAYADEILWRAKLSSFKMTTRLNNSEIKELHEAIIYVLIWSIDQIRKRGLSEKRVFLNIHNKKGNLCPRCGEPILTIRFSKKKTFYCPKCQTKGKKLKDRQMSKFYR